MKQFITSTVCVILLSPILVIMLIGYIPFAIFKGLTDNLFLSSMNTSIKTFLKWRKYSPLSRTE